MTNLEQALARMDAARPAVLEVIKKFSLTGVQPFKWGPEYDAHPAVIEHRAALDEAERLWQKENP